MNDIIFLDNIEFKRFRCKNNKVKEGVTTNHDECSGVGGSLSPVEARSSIVREEIV